jgi:G:T-mismatch repair DNA endonuclease (very short patch repair protein)
MDFLSKEQRSRNMRAIKSTGSRIEVKLCKALCDLSPFYVPIIS